MLDLHLPDVSGMEVLRLLRLDPRTAGLPIAIVSADARPSRVAELKGLGADHYLSKPIDLDNVLTMLDATAIAAGRPTPVAIRRRAMRPDG